MVKELKQLSVAIYHQDCVCSETTHRFPEITLRQESPVTILKQREGLLNYSILWTIEGPSRNYLESYLSHLKGRSDTIGLDVLQKRGASALALHHIKSSTSSYEEVLKKGLIYIDPISVNSGYEVHTTITANPGQIKRALNELEAIGEVKLLKVGNFDYRHNLYNLTPRQVDALKIAYLNGYYSWPRGKTLEGLSRSYGASRRGLQETLRKAESKIMPEIIKEIIAGKAALSSQENN